MNSRTPTRLDSESSAFDQTWQFPLFSNLHIDMYENNCMEFLYLMNLFKADVILKVIDNYYLLRTNKASKNDRRPKYSKKTRSTNNCVSI